MIFFPFFSGMFKARFFLIITFFGVISSAVWGQKSKVHVLTMDEAKIVKKDASTMFTTLDYKGALTAYLELYKTDSQNVEYNYRLGYCYLVTSTNRRAALKHLEFAIQSKDIKNDWFYYLGLAYMYNEKWDEAIKSFNDYKKSGTTKPIKDFLSPERLIEMCNNGKELMQHPVSCTFRNLGKGINSTYEEYNPFVPADERMVVFTSRRKGNLGGFIEDLGIYSADVYVALWRDTIWTKAKSTGANINTNWDEETVGISPSGNELYLYFDNETAFGDVGKASLKGKMWQKTEMFPVEINSKEEEYSISISQDGSMAIFSCNRKEGIGGKDLWMCKKENGAFGKAVNLGPNVNSTYDEKNPFLSLDGKRLYFSSKGWNSMGDFDIFYCDWSENENNWSKPINLGFPLNNADENSTICFTGNNRFAYLSAVRPEGYGDKDIYQVEFTDSINHPYSNFISGKLTGLTSRMVVKKISLEETKTGSKQEYNFENSVNSFVIPASPGDYKISVEGLNFGTFSDTLNVNNEFLKKGVEKTIPLLPSK